ncbi:Adhesion G protein-coupled receptor L3 [Holothuria leucospilota]|uniref:Adhesion G protein-coupled receptor L3 n=1 Tax=Holothuria leucospilota TaxID=206669 RepID=A0A9Q1CGH7_HOLLE|nr:Adhesion G protein-coupled receptor L3 [Holothuria leucospilota]
MFEFPCRDGTCIPEGKTCDGYNDCSLSEDEFQCDISETIFVTSSFNFTSVNYPSNYISNHQRETVFSTSDDSRLLLTLDFIYVQLHFDQFLVGNGNIPFLQPLLIWSGGPAVDSIKILSSGSSLWLVFITDSSVTRKGFSGTVQSVKNPYMGSDCMDGFDCQNGVCIPQELACDFQIHCANYFDEGFCFGEKFTKRSSTSTHLSTYKNIDMVEATTADMASTISTVSTKSTVTPSQGESTSGVDGCNIPGFLPSNLFVEPKATEYDEGTSIQYFCGDGFIINGNSKALCLNGKWLPPSVPKCEGFDAFETRLVVITDILSGQNVTSQDVERAADTIEKATDSKEFLKSDTDVVELIAVSLESVVEAGEPSLKVTDPVVRTINNLMDIDESVLQKGKTKTGRFVAALEKQISNMQTIEGNYSQILENVAVSAVKVNSSNVQKKLGFATFYPDYDPSLLEEDRREANIQTFLDREGFPVRETIASISLPKAAVGLLAEADQVNRQEVPVSFFVYNNAKLFHPTKRSEPSEMDLRSVVNEYIGSRIISAQLEHETVPNTTLPSESPVVIKFKTDSVKNADDTITDRECVFWNYDKETQEGFWSNDGCLQMPDELDLTVCSCNRFANFAVLIRIRLLRAHSATVPLHYVTLIGSIVSGTCLVLCILTLLSFKELRSRQTTYIHINICVSLLGFYTAFFPSTLVDVIRPVTCAVTSTAIQFFALSALTWMSVEAVNILILLVKLRKKNIRYFMPIACVLGYGCPVVAVVLVALFDLSSDYGNTSFCFIQPGYALYFGFLAEVFFLFLFNCIVFTSIICKMVCRPPTMSKRSDFIRFNECIVRVQHGVLFWFLFLVSWTFAFLSVTDKEKQIYEILYCTIVTSQGLAAFLLLCFANPSIRQLYTKVTEERKRDVQELREVSLSPGPSTSRATSKKEADHNMNDVNA